MKNFNETLPVEIPKCQNSCTYHVGGGVFWVYSVTYQPWLPLANRFLTAVVLQFGSMSNHIFCKTFGCELSSHWNQNWLFFSCLANANLFVAWILCLLCFSLVFCDAYRQLLVVFYSLTATSSQPSPRSPSIPSGLAVRPAVGVSCVDFLACFAVFQAVWKHTWTSDNLEEQHQAPPIAAAIPSSPFTPPAESGVGNTLVT